MTRLLGALVAAAIAVVVAPTWLAAIGLWLITASARRAYRHGFVAGFWDATLPDLLESFLAQASTLKSKPPEGK